MKELRIYTENNEMLISGFRLYSNFEDFVNHLMFIISNENQIIRKNLEDEYIYSIELDENLNRFIIFFEGEKYFIRFDDEKIRKFKLEEYDDITFELKRLIVAFEKRKEIEDKKYIIEKQVEAEKIIRAKEDKIIKDAKKGIFINEEAKRFFLEYLKQQNKNDSILLDLKKSFLGWKECEEKLVDAYVEHYVGHVPPNDFNIGGPIIHKEKIGQKLKISEFNYSPFKVFKFFAIILVVAYSIFLGDKSLIELGVSIGIDALVTSTWAIYHFISTRIQKRKERINNRKLIDKLEQELSNNQQNKQIVEKTKTKKNNIPKNKVLGEVNYLIKELECINTEDKLLILIKIKNIIDLYIKSQEISKSNSSIDNKALDKLNSNIIFRINLLKQKIYYLKMKENNNLKNNDKIRRRVLKPTLNKNNISSIYTINY